MRREAQGPSILFILLGGTLLGAVAGYFIGVLVDAQDSSNMLPDFEGVLGINGCIAGVIIGMFVTLVFIGLRYFGGRSVR